MWQVLRAARELDRLSEAAVGNACVLSTEPEQIEGTGEGALLALAGASKVDESESEGEEETLRPVQPPRGSSGATYMFGGGWLRRLPGTLRSAVSRSASA